MKVPLRFQVTEYDCASVSLLNAFSYLFDREDIPALIVKQIHKITLDCYDGEGNLGNGGTSREAIDTFTTWLSNYASSYNFGVECVRLVGEDVTIDEMRKCISNGGVVLIRCWQDVEHYAIITDIKDDKVFIFDPYYLEAWEYDDDDLVEVILDEPFKYNRVVSLERVLSESEEDFSLGVVKKRECVLINKKNLGD